ncbi:TPA: MscL family protein, partial [Streptococcus suis]|nr:MscL family protein [Streptococcus suis]
IDSFVADLITPLLLTPALKAAGADKIADLSWNGVTYGNFLSAVINFLIIGTVLFFIVKAAEKAMPKKEAAPAGPTQEELLAEIRDLLKK